MMQSLQGGREQEKGVGASRLTSQTCSFYAGVNAAGGECATARAVRRAGVEVRLDLEYGEAAALPCSPHRGATFRAPITLKYTFRVSGDDKVKNKFNKNSALQILVTH